MSLKAKRRRGNCYYQSLRSYNKCGWKLHEIKHTVKRSLWWKKKRNETCLLLEDPSLNLIFLATILQCTKISKRKVYYFLSFSPPFMTLSHQPSWNIHRTCKYSSTFCYRSHASKVPQDFRFQTKYMMEKIRDKPNVSVLPLWPASEIREKRRRSQCNVQS